MTATKRPIPARHKGFNRAEIVDQNFTEFVEALAGRGRMRRRPTMRRCCPAAN